ncbi:hypothetical protein [uncultured Chryseobacterium sp.]|uniref:hypothetical protein n=1 Tax=uncultured Chryseobacterium sp. TaxID=259322 RepID=UPI0025879012|nr:hypothetical protein [uncultured Chryseobacterium sp.]
MTKKYQIIDENGYIKNPKLLSESRYYYTGEKLVKITGIAQNPDVENSYLKESKTLRRDLEEYK